MLGRQLLVRSAPEDGLGVSFEWYNTINTRPLLVSQRRYKVRLRMKETSFCKGANGVEVLSIHPSRFYEIVQIVVNVYLFRHAHDNKPATLPHDKEKTGYENRLADKGEWMRLRESASRCPSKSQTKKY